MAVVVLEHKEHGKAIVEKDQWESDGRDGHGWSQKEAEARGWKVAKSDKKSDGK